MKRLPPVLIRWLVIFAAIAAVYIPWFLVMRWAVQDDHTRRTVLLVASAVGLAPVIGFPFIVLGLIQRQRRQGPKGNEPRTPPPKHP